MMCFDAVYSQRPADMSGREHACGGLDHFVKVNSRKRHAFVRNAPDQNPTFQQFAEKLFAVHRIVGEVMLRGLMIPAMDRDCIFDIVFCNHRVW